MQLVAPRSLLRPIRAAARDATRKVFEVRAGLDGSSRAETEAENAIERMGRLVTYSMLAADIHGRMELRDRFLRAPKRSQMPNWLTITPQEAIKYLLSLTPTDSGISSDNVRRTYERMEFRLRRGIGQDLVERAQQEIGSLLQEGGTIREFQSWASEAGRGHFSDGYAETVFRTETRRARSAGQTMQLREDPALRLAIVGAGWVTAGDGRVRDNHQKLNGHAWAIDHEVWDELDSPAGWNCRCQKIWLSRAAAKRRGRWDDDYGFISSPWPIPGAGPDPGFEVTPARSIYG